MNKIYKAALLCLTIFLLHSKATNAVQEDTKNSNADVIPKANEDNYLNNQNVEDLEVIEDDAIGDGSFPTIFIDWGSQICAKNKTQGLKTGFFGSRFLDLSVNYNLAIPNSNFALGVGLGYDNRTFTFSESGSEFYTLIRDTKQNRATVTALAKDCLYNKEDKDSAYHPKCRSSSLNTHFLDLILDLRFYVDKLYPKDSFIFSAGFKIGMLLGANTEIQYSQDAYTKEQYVHDKLNLKNVHWGFQARAAWRRFGIVYEIMLSDLFEKDRGPVIGNIQKFGISLDLL